MRDEPPCVFLSLNFKLQTNNFKQTAHTGNTERKTKMNKLIAVASIAASAAVSSSSLWAVTYDASDERPSYIVADENGSVVFDRDETSGAITNLVLMPNDGATLTLDGDVLSFAAGAKIVPERGGYSLGSSVIANPFTTAGTLQFVGVARTNITWNGGSTYLPDNEAMTILVGVYLEDLSPLLGGGKAGEANVTDYTACFPVRLEDGTLIFELQRYNNNNQSPNTRGSLIALKQFGNEIKAKWLIGGYKSNLKVVGQERLFNYTAVEGVPSWDNGTASAMSGVATNSGWQYARPNMLRFVPQGGVKRRLTFALTGSVTIPAVSGSNVEVTFDANGRGESTFLFTSGTLARNDNWQTLTTEHSLSEITLRSGCLAGSYIQGGVGVLDAIAFGWTNDNTTAGCQLQYFRDDDKTFMRAVDVVLRQGEGKVEIKRIRALYTADRVLMTAVYGKRYLTTEDTSTIHDATMVSPHWVSTKQPVVVVNASGVSTMTDSAYVVKGDEAHPIEFNVTNKDALPAGTTDCYGQSSLNLNAEATYTSGISEGKSAITMHPGSRLNSTKDWTLDPASQTIVLDDATFQLDNRHKYINDLILANGAVVVGSSARVGYMKDGTWRVTGEGVVTCGANVYIVDGADAEANALRSFVVDVDDTVVGSASDFIMSGNIDTWPTLPNGGMLKTGVGTMEMTGTLFVSNNPVRVAEGTLLLGTSGASMADVSFSLDGGTLGLKAGTTNVADSMAVTTASSLSVGAGASFVTDALTIGDGATLAIIGEPAKTSVKVNTALDAASLRKITVNGKRVKQTADGYLRENKGFMIIVK